MLLIHLPYQGNLNWHGKKMISILLKNINIHPLFNCVRPGRKWLNISQRFICKVTICVHIHPSSGDTWNPKHIINYLLVFIMVFDTWGSNSKSSPCIVSICFVGDCLTVWLMFDKTLQQTLNNWIKLLVMINNAYFVYFLWFSQCHLFNYYFLWINFKTRSLIVKAINH